MKKKSSKVKKIKNLRIASESKNSKVAHYRGTESAFSGLMKKELYKQIILIAIIVVLVIFFFMNLNKVGDFFNKLVRILTPVIFGCVLAFIMSPFYNILYSKFGSSKSKFSKIIATTSCLLVVVGVTIGIIFLFVPELYNSISRFISRAGGYVEKAREFINGARDISNNTITKSIIEQIDKSLPKVSEIVKGFSYGDIASGVYNGFAGSFKAVLNVFVGFVVMIYTLNMKEELSGDLKKVLFALTKKNVGEKILVEINFAKQVFLGFFAGKLLDSIIVGVICYICCMFMKMPYTPLISVIVGITNIIPFFGPFIGAVPSFILILLEETLSWKPFGFLVFILVIQQIDGNIIGPKILGDKTGLKSFWVLFSILLFGGLFGFVGMVIAVPLWAVISRLFNQFIIMKLVEKKYPLTSDEFKKYKSYSIVQKEED